jgi:hypothetical protein
MAEMVSGSAYVCQSLVSGDIILGFGLLTLWVAASSHWGSGPSWPVAGERSMTCHVIVRATEAFGASASGLIGRAIYLNHHRPIAIASPRRYFCTGRYLRRGNGAVNAYMYQ